MYVSRFKLRFMTLLLSCMLVLPAAVAQTNTDQAVRDLLKEVQTKAGIFAISSASQAAGIGVSQALKFDSRVNSINNILREDDEVLRSLSMIEFFLSETSLGSTYALHFALARDMHSAIINIADGWNRGYWASGSVPPVFVITFREPSSFDFWQRYFNTRPSGWEIADSLAYVRLVYRDSETSPFITLATNDEMCIATNTSTFNRECVRPSEVHDIPTFFKVPNYSIAIRPPSYNWERQLGGTDDEFFLFLCWEDTAINYDNLQSSSLTTGCPEQSVRTVIPLNSDFVSYRGGLNIYIAFEAATLYNDGRIIFNENFNLVAY